MSAHSVLPRFPIRWSMAVGFIVLAIYPALVIPQGSSCPRKCQCIWRDSKITVDCSDKSLASIPTTVEINTQGMINPLKLQLMHGKLNFTCLNKKRILKFK